MDNKFDYEVLDTGYRQEFPTGAVRDTGDKPRVDLVSPFFLERLGEWLRIGAKKYGERNWEKGMPISRFLASLERHLTAYKQAMYTGESIEDHLAAVAFNLMAIIHFEELALLNNDPEVVKLLDVGNSAMIAERLAEIRYVENMSDLPF